MHGEPWSFARHRATARTALLLDGRRASIAGGGVAALRGICYDDPMSQTFSTVNGPA